MNKLKDLYIEEILRLTKIDIAKSKLSDIFFENYDTSTKPFQNLFKDTAKVFKVANAIKTKNSQLFSFLTTYIPTTEASKFLEVYKELMQSEILTTNENRIVFKEDKTFYDEINKKGYNIRSGQNISKFIIAYFKNSDINENARNRITNNLDRMIAYMKNDFENTYLRIGIEPKDYFRMGQWGYDNNGRISTSCTYICPVEDEEIYSSITQSESYYKRAIITYMQMPTFVATLYKSEEDALNRDYTAIARQIFFYNEDISSLLGLRGYGPVNDVQTIRENVAKIMSDYQNVNYNDYLLENRVEGKKRQNIFPKNISGYRNLIEKKYNLNVNYDGYLGYLDTLHYNNYAKHALIHSISQQNLLSLFEDDDNEQTLLNSEAKELKDVTNELFKSFISLTQEENSSRFVHPCLTLQNIDDTKTWAINLVDEESISKKDYFFASKLLNETDAFDFSDRSSDILQYIVTSSSRNYWLPDLVHILDKEKADIIKSKTNIDLTTYFEDKDNAHLHNVLDTLNEMER